MEIYGSGSSFIYCKHNSIQRRNFRPRGGKSFSCVNEYHTHGNFKIFQTPGDSFFEDPIFLRERNLLGRPEATAPVASPPYSGPDHIPSSKFFIQNHFQLLCPCVVNDHKNSTFVLDSSGCFVFTVLIAFIYPITRKRSKRYNELG